QTIDPFCQRFRRAATERRQRQLRARCSWLVSAWPKHMPLGKDWPRIILYVSLSLLKVSLRNSSLSLQSRRVMADTIIRRHANDFTNSGCIAVCDFLSTIASDGHCDGRDGRPYRECAGDTQSERHTTHRHDGGRWHSHAA